MTDTTSDSPEPSDGLGALFAEPGEVVAGVVIETVPGEAPLVACRLASIDGLELVGGDGSSRLAAVWTAPSGKALEKAVNAVVRDDEQVIGVFPTFIGSE